MTRPGLPPIFRSTTSTFQTLAQHSLQQKGDPYRPRDSSSAARPPGRHREASRSIENERVGAPRAHR
jgi:hypothetical protein